MYTDAGVIALLVRTALIPSHSRSRYLQASLRQCVNRVMGLLQGVIYWNGRHRLPDYTTMR